MTGQFTGRHMTAILLTFFGVVIAVNVTMARFATSTFGGVVVENSYVASQHFNHWLDEAAAEQALGWKARLLRRTDGRIEADLSGLPAGGVKLSAIARHPLGKEADRVLTFAPDGEGHYLSTAALPEGRWRLRLEVRAADRLWRSEEDIG